MLLMLFQKTKFDVILIDIQMPVGVAPPYRFVALRTLFINNKKYHNKNYISKNQIVIFILIGLSVWHFF